MVVEQVMRVKGLQALSWCMEKSTVDRFVSLVSPCTVLQEQR